MISFGPNLRAIIRINLTFLVAFLLTVLTWLFWPGSIREWQFGLIAVLCGFASLCLAITAITDLGRHILRDIQVHRFQSKGRDPHSDGPVDEAELKRRGIIE